MPEVNVAPPGAASSPSQSSEAIAELAHEIHEAAHLLPAQGPINVFVHHNTLHAFEEWQFHEGVLRGAKVFGCQPYLSEARFRELLQHQRILPCDLEAALRDDLGARADDAILSFGTRLELRLTILEHGLRIAPAHELRWFVAETDALRRFSADVPSAVRQRTIEQTRHWVMRDLKGGGNSTHHERNTFERRVHDALEGLFDHFGRKSIEHWNEAIWEEFTLQALWRACREGVHGTRAPAAPASTWVRHRDWLLEACGADSDLLVHDVLIRFCSAFLDQGLSHWQLPAREQGLFAAFSALYRQAAGPPNAWLAGLKSELDRIESQQLTALEVIAESLTQLGVQSDERASFITSTLLALRGWAGMIHQMEIRTDRAAYPVLPGSLIEFLAVHLLLERLALAHVARTSFNYRASLSELRTAAQAKVPKHEPLNVDQRAFVLYQLAQLRGWLPVDLFRLSKAEWAELVGEVEDFSSMLRRQIFQEAYERRYRTQTLDALAIHAQKRQPRVDRPSFQLMTCIDDREESFRRHLEEVAPRVETFSVAGFYAVAMYYRGAADANYLPLCPVVIRPQHWVQEDVAFSLDEAHKRRAKARRALGKASHQIHVGSRSFIGGAIVTVLGALATIPLVARVLFPRLTARIRRSATEFVQPPTVTQLQLERSEPEAGPDNGHIGYTVDEMANIGERILRDLGLTHCFARLVLIIGHGSQSLNNPHNSAYNCGACSGAAGGPNARAAAQMLNDPRIRQILAERGLTIPGDTVFVGGYHNTCDDSVVYYDLERLPKTHQDEFSTARAQVLEACERNAHERCRRFVSAPLNMSFPAALRHVEARSEDLSQTRPECGHATNALCIVGRRERTRGLFMDRRAFLNSYDPEGDTPDHAILTRILQAAVPVCAGISLEYYFSYVDPIGWGCSTKLPHNVAAMLGVMDGAASDLRTGLPWQMVEIHEPIRLLFIIETTPEAMNQIMDRNPGIAQLCRHDWVQLATLDPNGTTIHLLRDGKFEVYQPQSHELPHAKSSTEWYRGWRDHLGFAAIDAPPATPTHSYNGHAHHA
jgi:uncharacterized protein YbcC (UPF0753/DUF2309 family)